MEIIVWNTIQRNPYWRCALSYAATVLGFFKGGCLGVFPEDKQVSGIFICDLLIIASISQQKVLREFWSFCVL